VPTLKEINPIIPVADVIKSAEFFECVLGFSSLLKESHIAIVKRDSVGLRLIRAGGDAGELSCCIEVDGVDGLYQDLKVELDKLPEGRVRALFNQEY
jgi:hypothetical protein